MKLMKTNILILLMFFSLSALGFAPIRLEGNFTFDSISLELSKDIEVVPASNKTRVEELKNDNFSCQHVAKFYRCSKFLKETTLPEALEREIRTLWVGKKISFKPSEADAVITNDSPAILEWDIPDTVKSGKDEVRKYHYYLLQSKIHKIKVPFNPDIQWLLIQDEGKISAHYLRTVQVDRWRMKEYVILINLLK